MAEANEKLKQQMADAPAGHFDIESVEGEERVIEMVSVCQKAPDMNVKRPDVLCHNMWCLPLVL